MQDMRIRRRLREIAEARTRSYMAGVESSIRIDGHVDRVRRGGEALVRAERERGATAVRAARSEADDLVERADATGRELIRGARSRGLTLAPTEASGRLKAAERERERLVGIASAEGRALVDEIRADSAARVGRVEALCAEDSERAEADARAARPEIKAARTDRLKELDQRRKELEGLLGTGRPRGELRSLLRKDRERERTSLSGFRNRLARAELRAGLLSADVTAHVPASAPEALAPGQRHPGAAAGLRGAVARASGGKVPQPRRSASREGDQRSDRRGRGL
ncbi:hypothetical protein SUDANB121_03588 [Nocardiopsis dassonvillei]